MDAASGKLLWNQLLPDNVTSLINVARWVAILDSVIVAPSGYGEVYVLSRSTGVIQRILPHSIFRQPSQSSSDGETYHVHNTVSAVYNANSHARMTALDPQTFAVKWSAYDAAVAGGIQGMTSDDLHLYVSSNGDRTAVRRLTDGKLVWYADRSDLSADGMEGTLRAPAVRDGMVYIGGHTYGWYAFRRR